MVSWDARGQAVTKIKGHELGFVMKRNGEPWRGLSIEAYVRTLSSQCHQSMAGQDVVGQREPMQHRIYFLAPANGELVEVPLSEARVDAFAHCAPLENAFTVRALHALAPGGNSRTIFGARSIRIGLVLTAHRRTVDVHALRGGPFGVLVLVESAVDEMTLGQPAVAMLQLVKHRTDQPAVRAVRLGFHGDHDLAFGHGSDLAVVGRPKTAVCHLHHTRVRIGGGGTRLLALLLPLAVPLFPLLATLRNLRQRFLRRRDSLGTLARRTFLRRFDPPIAGIRVVVRLLFQALDQPRSLPELLMKLLLAAKRTRPSRGAHPHSILDYLVEVDHTGHRQGGDVVGQQAIEQLTLSDTKVRKAVIVYTHTAAQPSICVVSGTQSIQCSRTADALADGEQPQRQQQPRARRCLPRRVCARPDPLLQFSQI